MASSNEPGSTPQTLFNPAYRRSREDIRFEISAEQYLASHSIPEYFSDAVRLMTEADDNAPLEFLSAYFQNVLTGDNVIFRNFSYVDSTSRNRRSFIRYLRETYQNFDSHEEISVESLHQLFCLLCPDYPIHYIRCAAQIYNSNPTLIASGDAGCPLQSLLSKPVPFHEFVLFVCLLFYFSEFISVCGNFFVQYEQNTTTDFCKNALQQYLHGIVKTKSILVIPDQRIIDDTLETLSGSSSASFELFCYTLFTHSEIPMALLEPTSYSELKEGIDRLLLENMSEDKEVDIARAKRKQKRKGTKDLSTIDI